MKHDKLDQVWNKLKMERDELRVQAHLARAEWRDEWAELEDKFGHVQGRIKVLGHETGEAADEARKSVKIVMDEVADAYKRMKVRLKEE